MRNKKKSVVSAQVGLVAGLLIFNCLPAHAEGEKFRSGEYIYNQCSTALNHNDFDESYCAAFLEGYIRGSAITNLHDVAKRSKKEDTRKIIKEEQQRTCALNDKYVYGRSGPKWLAKFFVNSVESLEVVKSDKDFLSSEASIVLYAMLNDDRFCTNQNVRGSK